MRKLREVAAYVVRECLFLKEGESVLIVTDENKKHLSLPFFKEARKITDTFLLLIPPLSYHAQEPNPLVAQFMQKVDVLILLTTFSITHTEAIKNACRNGAKVISMPGIESFTLKRAIIIDYKKQKEEMEHFLSKIEGKKEVFIKTEKGTAISFLIEGREWFIDDGMPKKGKFSNLPAGELFIAPVEESASGILVVDASIASVKKRGILKIHLEDGRIKRVEGRAKKRFLRLLEKDEKCMYLCEFGIGFNEYARLCGNPLEDEKVKGTVHVAFGKNTSFGGKIDAPLHIDCIIKDATIYFDGLCVMKEGKSAL